MTSLRSPKYGVRVETSEDPGRVVESRQLFGYHAGVDAFCADLKKLAEGLEAACVEVECDSDGEDFGISVVGDRLATDEEKAEIASLLEQEKAEELALLARLQKKFDIN